MSTVTARIDDELKEQIDELDINTTKVVREALSEEVRRRRRERLEERGKDFEGTLSESGVSTEDIVVSVREDRNADLKDR